jgi:hypothetical protein
MVKAAAVNKPPLVMPLFDLRTMEITLIGDAPLICHRWSDKARKEILDKQMKRAKAAKDAKSPETDFLDSLYPYPGGGWGFPTIAFKAAAVDACSHVDGITKVEARGAFHIGGELVKLEGEPRLREDMVRIGMGTADIRFRGEFNPWRTTLLIRHNAGVLSAEQITHLFTIAGFAIGVGEWRPQKDGMYGLFHVKSTGDV